VAIPVADDDDENDHRNQPPMKKARISSIPRLRDKQTDERHHCEKRRQTGYQSLSRNVPVPRETLDSNPASAEEVMGIKLLCNLMCVPVPNRRGQHCDAGECDQL
jgi:hypothetical protein